MARSRSARTVDELIQDARKRPRRRVPPVWLVWSGIGVALLCVVLAVVFWPRGPQSVPAGDELKKKMDDDYQRMMEQFKKGKSR
jgi:hypothetical protein